MAGKPKKKTTPKKTPAKKTRKATIQRTGHNINIKLDQSKRSIRTGASAPRQPQIISTFTPVQAPAPIYNFPLPTNLNPFESVLRETQKPKIQEKNELEKPKPKEEEQEQEDDSIFHLGDFETKVKRKQQERDEMELMRNEDFDAPPKKPLLLMDKDMQAAIISRPKERREREEMGQEDILSHANRERKNNTPLQEEQKKVNEKQNLLTVFQPKTKEKTGGSNIMTLQKLNEPPSEERRMNKEFNAFAGGGNMLGGDGIMGRLNREEMRKKRLESLDKEKYSIEPLESFKSPETNKEEKELEDYRAYLKGFSIQGLRTEAKKQKLKYPKTTSKQELFNLLIDNRKK